MLGKSLNQASRTGDRPRRWLTAVLHLLATLSVVVGVYTPSGVFARGVAGATGAGKYNHSYAYDRAREPRDPADGGGDATRHTWRAVSGGLFEQIMRALAKGAFDFAAAILDEALQQGTASVIEDQVQP